MVLKCPKCKSASITPYMGGQFGQYDCKVCSYIGTIILEEDESKSKISQKKKSIK